MTKSRARASRPTIFRTGDPAVRLDMPQPDQPAARQEDDAATLPMPAPVAPTRRAFSWTGLFVSALASLVGLAAGVALMRLVEDLFARSDWLGWTATGLAGLAGLALAAIILREIAGLARLRRLARLQAQAGRAARGRDMVLARRITGDLARLYVRRRDVAWGLQRLRDHQADIFDADDLLRLAEREVLKDLDAAAAREVARAARRVSIITALSPAALVDMGFVLFANLALLRKLATLYGGRPGTIGLLRLARMVLAHLTLTGGLALGDSAIQQVLGHGIAAKLSARLGEGVLNGLFTARIGLAAIEVCRPLPFLALRPPALKEVAGNLAAREQAKG